MGGSGGLQRHLRGHRKADSVSAPEEARFKLGIAKSAKSTKTVSARGPHACARALSLRQKPEEFPGQAFGRKNSVRSRALTSSVTRNPKQPSTTTTSPRATSRPATNNSAESSMR